MRALAAMLIAITVALAVDAVIGLGDAAAHHPACASAAPPPWPLCPRVDAQASPR